MAPQQHLRGAHSPSKQFLYVVTHQLGEDQQAAVRPAAPLDQQGAAVRRRSAVREALLVVVETPVLRHEIDSRLRILDHRAVLDEARHVEAALRDHLNDVVERSFAQHGIGTDPVRCVATREALMDEVLNIGSCTRPTSERDRAARDGRIRCLGNGDAFVAGLLHVADQRSSVGLLQEGVGIKGHDVFRLGD